MVLRLFTPGLVLIIKLTLNGAFFLFKAYPTYIFHATAVLNVYRIQYMVKETAT